MKLLATGPVALRHASVESHPPIPALAPAEESISVDAVNATALPQDGVLIARVKEAGIKIEKRLKNRCPCCRAKPKPCG